MNYRLKSLFQTRPYPRQIKTCNNFVQNPQQINSRYTELHKLRTSQLFIQTNLTNKIMLLTNLSKTIKASRLNLLFRIINHF